LSHNHYRFEVTINPSRRDERTGKTVAVTGHNDVIQWFARRSVQSWGFTVAMEHLQVEQMGVQRFEKDGQTVTHGSVTVTGVLDVLNRDSFIHSFTHGIGRGRACGFGRLQGVPL
jgi:CRISPR system Cascade subunit CasE